MTVTSTWKIEQLDCYPTKEGQTDVVFTIHWRVNGTDGTYDATNYGTLAVTYVADAAFTPYANLTQDQVIGWVKDSMGADMVADIEAGISVRIANLANPPVISPALPWATT
jgi:hypothetical protein